MLPQLQQIANCKMRTNAKTISASVGSSYTAYKSYLHPWNVVRLERCQANEKRISEWAEKNLSSPAASASVTASSVDFEKEKSIILNLCQQVSEDIKQIKNDYPQVDKLEREVKEQKDIIMTLHAKLDQLLTLSSELQKDRPNTVVTNANDANDANDAKAIKAEDQKPSLELPKIEAEKEILYEDDSDISDILSLDSFQFKSVNSISSESKTKDRLLKSSSESSFHSQNSQNSQQSQETLIYNSVEDISTFFDKSKIDY